MTLKYEEKYFRFYNNYYFDPGEGGEGGSICCTRNFFGSNDNVLQMVCYVFEEFIAYFRFLNSNTKLIQITTHCMESALAFKPSSSFSSFSLLLNNQISIKCFPKNSFLYIFNILFIIKHTISVTVKLWYIYIYQYIYFRVWLLYIYMFYMYIFEKLTAHSSFIIITEIFIENIYIFNCI